MTILGNIFLGLAGLIYLAILGICYGKEPPRSGDGLMGYPFAVILVHLALLVCLGIATIAIGNKGGFGWVGASGGARFFIVLTGLLAAVITAGMSAMMKYENGPVSMVLRFFSVIMPAILPLLMIATGFMLLNVDPPGQIAKMAAQTIFAIGIVGVGATLYDWISMSNANARRRMETAIADQDRYHQQHLDQIDTCNVMERMAEILVFTDANQDQDVRERAVAKIKTNPNWQQELIRMLKNDASNSAFDFLASNEVDDKSLFPEAVKEGLLSTAKYIRSSIRGASHPSHFYDRWFYWEVERGLRTADKFNGMGVDFLPAVQEMRAALDEPASVEKSPLDCQKLLDQWIKKHQ